MTNTDTTLAAELAELAERAGIDHTDPMAWEACGAAICDKEHGFRIGSMASEIFPSALDEANAELVAKMVNNLPTILAALTRPAVPDVREAVTEAETWLRECSAWLLSTDLDMTCPMETDPLDIADKLAALTQSPTCCEAERWQPIETAPKDGTPVLLTIAGRPLEPGEDTHCGIGRWSTDAWSRESWCMDAGDFWPGATHWQPLPEPPAPFILPEPVDPLVEALRASVANPEQFAAKLGGNLAKRGYKIVKDET